MTPGPAFRFSLLYAAQFTAVGVVLPFFPAVLAGRGLSAEEVGVVLATGSAVRLLAGPLGGRLADALGEPRRVLVLGAAVAACAAAGFGLAAGFLTLLVVQILYAMAFAPVIPLSDALAVTASRAPGGFDYARVRAVGSIAFILAALGTGQVVALFGIGLAPWLMVGALAATSLAARHLPRDGAAPAGKAAASGFFDALRVPTFRRLLIVSALIQGSHAMYYAFGTLHWQAAGLSPGLIGALWSTGVVAEILLFLWGRQAVARFGLVGLSLIAALGGVVRWGVTAETVFVPLLFLVQVLHGATFGAQHLAAMNVLGRVIPPREAATAQTLHQALGVGLWSGLLMAASGPLYAALGGQGFWVMAALCAAALPAALGLGAALRPR